MTRPRPVLLATTAAVLCLVLIGWILCRARTNTSAPSVTTPGAQAAPAPEAKAAGVGAGDDEMASTTVYAHNLLLRKGPQFRIYIRWISGKMLRTHKGTNPSFDDPESFVLEIEKGVIRANIGDTVNFLNANSPKDNPLKNITIEPVGDQLKLRGTVHKIVPLPIELDGGLSPTPDGRIQFHVTKIDVLKIPLKGLLGGFHLKLSDLVSAKVAPGVQIAGNDIFFDTQKLLPPPHIHGQISTVRVSAPDIELIYGNAPVDESSLMQWHNFIRLRGGTLDFGKLTMHHVDLTMIDASQDPWFDLDLVNYQAQLVNGYTRMTAQAGLEIYMPDLDDLTKKKKASQGITLEWLKDRNRSVPADVPGK